MKFLKFFFKLILFLCAASLLLAALSAVIEHWYFVVSIVAIFVAIFIAWKIYEFFYFHSKSFLSIKERINSYIVDSNNLNEHIEELKQTHIGENRLELGESNYKDTSKWNVKRPELRKQKYAPNVYNCTRTVCDGARREPFKYVCKYFGIKATEEVLCEFENTLNNFEAVEEGKTALKQERENILASVQNDIPFLIRKLSKEKLESQLGFDEVDFSTDYFPKYIFNYISSGGNTSTQCEVVLDIENLNKFVAYLSEKVKFKNSAAGQRALMTSKLRQEIKERDHFSCRNCGVSIEKEPTLLLEIDHIIPISKGGLTTEDNLQTLCWRCNRSKGAKL